MQTTIKNTDGKKVISMEDWESRLDSIQISKDLINKLVLNYLVIEGYKEAAEEFVGECGLAGVETVDLGSIENRLRVREAIQSGNIPTAITELNNLDPQILDSNPSICFHLRQQEFLEELQRVRMESGSAATGDFEGLLSIIRFAQENLAPLAQEYPEKFLPELEDCMGLLASDLGATQWPNQHLLGAEQRMKTAKEANSAILASQAQPESAKLPEVMALLQWAQEQLGERAVFPKLIDPVNGTFLTNNK